MFSQLAIAEEQKKQEIIASCIKALISLKNDPASKKDSQSIGEALAEILILDETGILNEPNSKIKKLIDKLGNETTSPTLDECIRTFYYEYKKNYERYKLPEVYFKDIESTETKILAEQDRQKENAQKFKELENKVKRAITLIPPEEFSEKILKVELENYEKAVEELKVATTPAPQDNQQETKLKKAGHHLLVTVMKTKIAKKIPEQDLPHATELLKETTKVIQNPAVNSGNYQLQINKIKGMGKSWTDEVLPAMTAVSAAATSLAALALVVTVVSLAVAPPVAAGLLVLAGITLLAGAGLFAKAGFFAKEAQEGKIATAAKEVKKTTLNKLK